MDNEKRTIEIVANTDGVKEALEQVLESLQVLTAQMEKYAKQSDSAATASQKTKSSLDELSTAFKGLGDATESASKLGTAFDKLNASGGLPELGGSILSILGVSGKVVAGLMTAYKAFDALMQIMEARAAQAEEERKQAEARVAAIGQEIAVISDLKAEYIELHSKQTRTQEETARLQLIQKTLSEEYGVSALSLGMLRTSYEDGLQAIENRTIALQGEAEAQSNLNIARQEAVTMQAQEREAAAVNFESLLREANELVVAIKNNGNGLLDDAISNLWDELADKLSSSQVPGAGDILTHLSAGLDRMELTYDFGPWNDYYGKMSAQIQADIENSSNETLKSLQKDFDNVFLSYPELGTKGQAVARHLFDGVISQLDEGQRRMA